jgi:hypothetical protein
MRCQSRAEMQNLHGSAEFASPQELPGAVQIHAEPMRGPTHNTHLIGQRIASSRDGRSTKMPLLNLVVVLIIVGVALYLVNRYIPMASSIKTILNVLVVVMVCVWLLQAVGLWGSVTSFKLHG